LASAVVAAPFNTIPIAKTNPTTNACGTPSLPVNGGATELPAPNGTLAYVALGRGIQNYTCSAVGATPVAIGAIATLYDATNLAECDTASFDTVPGVAVYTALPSSSNVSFMGLNVLGKHFFGADSTPTFDLTSVSKILYASKAGDIAAPSNASRGPADTGAVDWLKLTAKTGYASVGLTEVYRVETAGGSSINPCTTAGVESVQYAAQYWFYS